MTRRLAALVLVALSTAGDALPAQSGLADSLYRAGRRHLSAGDYTEAITDLAQVIRLEPPGRRLADARYWQAFAKYQVGGRRHLAEAVTLLTDVLADGGAPHRDTEALLARIRAQLRLDTGDPSDAAATRRSDPAATAAWLMGLASTDFVRARGLAESILVDSSRWPVLVRRTAVIILGRAADPGRFAVLRRAAEHDASDLLRVDALYRLRADTSFATHAVLVRLASRPVTDLVTNAAASQLAWMSGPGATQRLLAFLADTTVSPVHRQMALSQLRRSGALRLDPLVLRSLLPRLTGGSAQSTLLEVVAATGDDRDRDWIWRVVLDHAVAPLARVTGLEQVGRLRRPSELGDLFREDPPQLVRYALLEQLRRHPSPEAGTMLRALLRAESPGVMRDAIRAALEARIRRP